MLGTADRHRPETRVRGPPLATLALLVALTGCGSDSPSGVEPDPDTGPDSEPVDTRPDLECGLPTHPCAWSGVSAAVVDRTLALRDEALARLDDGSDTDAVHAWLEAEDDVVEVQSDDLVLRFRLEGGRGAWIYLEGALQIVPDPEAAPPSPPADRPARHVVGDAPAKRALVLSPQLWEFGEQWTDATEVAAILEGTRGYEGGVDLLANAEQTSTEVGPAAFKGWDAYDVIHYNGHGLRVCIPQGCRATLMLGLLENVIPGGASETAKILQLDDLGLELSVGKRTGNTYVLVGADFFEEHYPGGLDETLVFLNSCETVGPQATDLADVLRGTTSVVLGWSQAVVADDGIAASLAFWENVSEHGYPVQVAWEKLGDLRTGEATRFSPGDPPRLTVAVRPDGEDLHIREVVTLLNPQTGSELDASPPVPIIGDADDGIPDAAPFVVRVEGIVEEFAGDMAVSVTVDGVAADPVPLSDGVKDDDDAWIVEGLVQLPYDLTDDRTVPVEARVTLHTGGESTHETTATLTGSTPLMGYEWEFVASHTTYWTGGIPHTPYTQTTTMTLEFAPGQDPSEEMPEYVVTGGTVVWEYDHSYYDCVFTSDRYTFDAAEIITGNSVLRFDARVVPARYQGYLYTFGPIVPFTSNCGDGVNQRTTRASNVWMELQGAEWEAVSADGTSITGTYTSGTDFGGYAFVLESNYTITRIR